MLESFKEQLASANDRLTAGRLTEANRTIEELSFTCNICQAFISKQLYGRLRECHNKIT